MDHPNVQVQFCFDPSKKKILIQSLIRLNLLLLRPAMVHVVIKVRQILTFGFILLILKPRWFSASITPKSKTLWSISRHRPVFGIPSLGIFMFKPVRSRLPTLNISFHQLPSRRPSSLFQQINMRGILPSWLLLDVLYLPCLLLLLSTYWSFMPSK